jgi:hypothetical protein
MQVQAKITGWNHSVDQPIQEFEVVHPNGDATICTSREDAVAVAGEEAVALSEYIWTGGDWDG